MEQVLHLYITTPCGHKCPLCCNRLYDIEKIPVVTVELLNSVQTICLTGGDPMMIHPKLLAKLIIQIESQAASLENLYIYTSGKYLRSLTTLTDEIRGIEVGGRWVHIDGINVAPKNWEDWEGFIKTVDLETVFFRNHTTSNRLYLFKEQRPIFEALNIELPKTFQVIDRQWTQTFNTPDNEHFCRLPILM